MFNIKIINTFEDKCNEAINKEIVDFYERSEKEISIIEETYQEYLFKISSNAEYYKANTSKAWDEMLQVNSVVENSLQVCSDVSYQLITNEHNVLRELEKQALSIAETRKEFNIIKYRLIKIRNKTIKYVRDYEDDIDMKLDELISEKREQIKAYLIENIEEENKKQLDELQQEYCKIYLDSSIKKNKKVYKENRDIEKIFDYKDMSKQAEDNGYIYKWSRGSHNIYEHKASKKIIVIPAHSLGIGLSKKILKQIEANKICS